MLILDRNQKKAKNPNPEDVGSEIDSKDSKAPAEIKRQRKMSQNSHLSKRGSPELRIGTSGYVYKHWKNLFYPADLPQSKWLDYYSQHFDTVELNATFYRLPKGTTFENWYRRTPENFLWAIKASKFITHTRRLRDPGEPLDRLYRAAGGLKGKLGPILFQLPPSLTLDRTLLTTFCKDLQLSFLHVLEIRHASWIDEDVFKILRDHNIAFCISDTAGRYPYTEVLTADFVYIRLHGSRKLYASEYTEEELREWADKIRGWDKKTYLYFDNDFEGHAIKNATRLKEILDQIP